MPDAQAAILIVDDDSSIRISLSLIFSALGYSVRSCFDGLSAMSEIRTEIPDVLLADLNMARLPGSEFLGMVRRWFPSIRIIAMTGAFTLNSDPLRGAADAFYQKGGGPLHLIRRMNPVPGFWRGFLRIPVPCN
jgi:CheY-like chemotaxis protein